jgi:hypothetical protein
MGKITKRTVDELQRSKVSATLRDQDLSGFCCRRNRDGSVSYYVEYRPGRGRGVHVRRVVLGKHGHLTPEQARNSARLILSQVAQGKDPAAERSAATRQPTVAEVLDDALVRHWRPKRKPSTVTSFEQIIRGRLVPRFGALPLNELRRVDIRCWHAELWHIPVRANRALAVLRKALSIAVADELLATNPALGITHHPERARDRHPSNAELRGIWSACERGAVSPGAATLFRLLVLTGCRCGELRTARAEWGDHQNQ